MDAIPSNKVKKFERWLTQMGSEILPPTSEFELIRFNCSLGVGVLYQGRKGISVSNQIVTVAIDCYLNNKAWEGKGAPGKRMGMTKKQQQLLARDGGDCFYCGHQMSKSTISVEHVLSVLHNGPNRIENLVLAHKKCNELASHLSVIEKIKMRDELRGNT